MINIGKGVTVSKEDYDKIGVEFNRLRKLIPENIEINGALKLDKYNEYIAELHIYYIGHFIKGSGASANGIALAVDEAVDEIIRKVRKVKTELIDKKRRLDINFDSETKPITTEEPTMADFEEFGLQSDNITITKSIDMKPLTIDEAIDRLESCKRDFYVFYDLDNNVRVIYKRTKHEGYGLLCD